MTATGAATCYQADPSKSGKLLASVGLAGFWDQYSAPAEAVEELTGEGTRKSPLSMAVPPACEREPRDSCCCPWALFQIGLGRPAMNEARSIEIRQAGLAFAFYQTIRSSQGHP